MLERGRVCPRGQGGVQDTMGETPRRSAFRLPWSDSGEAKPEEPAAEAASAPDEVAATGQPAPAGAGVPAMTPPEPGAPTERAGEPNLFLRELVDAMRGVAEQSRDSTLQDLRTALDERIEQMRAAASEHAEDLRRRSDHDVTAVGEWERTEAERIRAEAEQRRDARRAKLESELAEHEAASQSEMEAARRRLADYESELSAFFVELGEIKDPAVFAAAAKRMPKPPDLAASATAGSVAGPEANGAAAMPRSEMTLSQRLAQLDEQLASTPAEQAAPPAETAAAAEPTAAAMPSPVEPTESTTVPTEAEPAVEPVGEPAPAEPGTAEPTPVVPPTQPAPEAQVADALTPIIVKGLGSFGAITSFKQALERVDGVSGVTLSLGPTGEFVYRASHAPEFDLVAAIRQIEGPGAGIEQSEGQVLVSIERQR